jgi:hypothetical protein
VVQLDLDQPSGQQFRGREWCRVQNPHPDLPRLIRQLLDNGPQGHRRVGQVGHQILGCHRGASFDVGLLRLRAGVRRTILPGPGPDQQVPHGVRVTGHVRQDVRPSPARQQ